MTPMNSNQQNVAKRNFLWIALSPIIIFQLISLRHEFFAKYNLKRLSAIDSIKPVSSLDEYGASSSSYFDHKSSNVCPSPDSFVFKKLTTSAHGNIYSSEKHCKCKNKKSLLIAMGVQSASFSKGKTIFIMVHSVRSKANFLTFSFFFWTLFLNAMKNRDFIASE